MPAGSSCSGGKGRPPDDPPDDPPCDGREPVAPAWVTPRPGSVPATARPTPAAPPVRIWRRESVIWVPPFDSSGRSTARLPRCDDGPPCQRQVNRLRDRGELDLWT